MLTPAQVRGARAMLEMKQEDLAKEAGTQRSVLAAFEGGQSTPREATLARIQAVLEGRGVAFLESDLGRGLLLTSQNVDQLG